MPDEPFCWQGETLTTVGDILEAITAVDSPEEAHAFMDAYRKTTPYAYVNVGYLAGYCDPETAARIYEWFETSHPLTGTRHLSMEESVELGKQWMTAMMQEKPNSED